MDSPGKDLAGAACSCQGNMPNASRAATLEPESSDALNHIGTKAREAPLWWHADLCEDQEHARLDENQKTTILSEILAKEVHETPGKILAEDDHCAAARPLPGPRQGPCRRHLQGRSQARICQDPTGVPM